MSRLWHELAVNGSHREFRKLNHRPPRERCKHTVQISSGTRCNDNSPRLDSWYPIRPEVDVSTTIHHYLDRLAKRRPEQHTHIRLFGWHCNNPFLPFINKEWVLVNAPDLERAEIHEMHGRVRCKLDQLNAEESYIEARHAYQRFIRSNPSRECARIAREGLGRVDNVLEQISQRTPLDENGGEEAAILVSEQASADTSLDAR
jgi:hypothetical protein